MTRQQFRQLCEEKILLLDGATGSNLQAAGMPTGVCVEKWVLDNKEVLIDLQTEYLRAGSDILYAPTFTANRIKLEEYGLADRIEEMNRDLVTLSKEAIERYRKESGDDSEKYVAGDITMTGKQLEPAGSMKFEELVTVYKEQVACLVKAGADLLVIETMISLQECRAALIAAKETCDLPVMVTLTFKDDNKTFYGTDPKTAIIVLQELGADAVGVNCSPEPGHMKSVIEEMKSYARVPVIAKANAGLPVLKDGKASFTMGPEEYREKVAELMEAGAGIIGGCCGTTPACIRQLKEEIKNHGVPVISDKKIRAITTERNTLEIALDQRFMVIGERINPTGKKALQAQLKEGCLELVCEMAEQQEEHGADILDINMGMNGIDEKEMMLRVVKEVTNISSLPLCIDSSHVEVIEAALRIYPGRALINSISLEKVKFERLIPIAKKYGAMFILLPLSDAGLPKNIEEKKEIIHTILEEAKRQGLSKEDIIVDGLVNTIGANKKAAIETMETIRYCREELGLATVCGLSNISFGLPDRPFVNSTFLTLAIQAGLTMAIANPSNALLMNTAYAADLLMNKEEADLRYIERVTTHKAVVLSEKEVNKLKESGSKEKEMSLAGSITKEKEHADKAAGDKNHPVYEAVLKGNRRKIVDLVKEEHQAGIKPGTILNEYLIPAINEVGELFDKGIYFLPQLIGSAEAMKLAIEYLEPYLSEGGEERRLGTIVIATVAGDIHDIGKNLVALMLKNYGFHVIDLGKDVASDLIIQTAKEENADIIALSALMTTTMLEMKEVVRLRNEAGLRAKIMIGGAVITQSYCDEIAADGYSKDAGEAVVVAKQLLGIA